MAGRAARPTAGTADDKLRKSFSPQPVSDGSRDSRMACPGIHRSVIGCALTAFVAMVMLPAFASAGAPPADIVDYFRLYYQAQVAGAPEGAVLDFLRSAAANHE